MEGSDESGPANWKKKAAVQFRRTFSTSNRVTDDGLSKTPNEALREKLKNRIGQTPPSHDRPLQHRPLTRVSSDYLTGAFSASFVKVLKPELAESDTLQITCMACSDDGEVLVTGGSITRPGRVRGTQAVRGALYVWQRSLRRHDLGQWYCWGIDAAEESQRAPVNCISLEGDVLVSGHVTSWELGKEEPTRHFSGNIMSMPTFSRTRSSQTMVPEISVWKLDPRLEDVQLQNEDTSGDGDVSAVELLRPRRHGARMRLATAANGKVTIWEGLEPDSDALVKLFSFVAHHDKVSSLAYLSRVYGNPGTIPDLLATASSDKTVILWELHPDGAEPSHMLDHAREVYGTKFFAGDDIDPDSEYIVTTNHDQSMRLWHVASGICVHDALHDHPVTAVDFQATGELIATGSLGGEVSLFDAKTGIRMRTQSGHQGVISAVKFLDRFDLLASASSDGTIRIWEVKNSSLGSVHKLGERSRVLSGQTGHGKTVYCIQISADSETMATASRDNTVKLWDCSSGRLLSTLEGHTNFVFMVAIHPLESLCATASHDCSIRIWSTRSGRCVQVISRDAVSPEEEESEVYHSAEVSAVAFHPQGEIMASSSYDMSTILYTRDSPSEETDEEARLWVPYRVLAHHTDRIWDITFSHCAMYLASAAWDNTVHVYKMNDPELSTEPEEVFFDANEVKSPQYATLNCMAKVWSVAFRPGASSVNTPIILTGAADSKIRVWERDVWGLAWKQQVALEGHSNTVTGLAWHPEGKMFVSSSFDKTVRLWLEKQTAEGATYEGLGLWSAYNWPTMAVAWANQPYRASGTPNGATMIAIAALDGSAWLMDASDAGQQFVPHARINHVLQQGEGFSRDMLLEIVNSFPQSLMSLGADSGVLMQAVIRECDDLKLFKRLLDLYQSNGVTPLLPYGPKGKPLLAAINSYHEVAAVISCAVEMGDAGASMSAAAMASGTGTCVILMLIEKFPDQAVKLLNHLGMVKANDVVYKPNWSRRRSIPPKGMLTQDYNDFKVGCTRYPKSLWGPERKSVSGTDWIQKLLAGHTTTTEKVDVVALHSAFPYIVGLLPEEYLWESETKSLITSFTANAGNLEPPDYSSLEKSFLHLAHDSNEPRLFDTPVGRAILNFKWEAYGRRVLLSQAAIFFLQLVSICVQAYSLGRLNHGGGWVHSSSDRNSLELQASIAAGLVLFFSLLQSVYEVMQIRAEGLKMYLGDLWSVLDVWVLLLGILSGVLGLFHTAGGDLISMDWLLAVSSVASFFAWMKVLYFLRAFPTTGGLVRMVVQIGYDMRYLLVLLLVVMLGAATAFFVLMTIGFYPALSSTCSADDWEELQAIIDGTVALPDEQWQSECQPPLSFWGMVLYTFGMMLGGFDITFFDTLGDFRLLGQVLFILYALFQMILLLNLLIALMGDSYEKVQEKANTEALRERAGLLVEIELVMGQNLLKKNNYCPRWLHALVHKETMQPGDVSRAREWAGITGTIRQDLDTQLSTLKANMQDEMDRHTETIMEVISRRITEHVKELGLEVRSELQNHMKLVSQASGNITPNNAMTPSHPRRLLSLAHHRRTMFRRTMTSAQTNFSKSNPSLFPPEPAPESS